MKKLFCLEAMLAVFLAGPPIWWAGDALREAWLNARIARIEAPPANLESAQLRD